MLSSISFLLQKAAAGVRDRNWRHYQQPRPYSFLLSCDLLNRPLDSGKIWIFYYSRSSSYLLPLLPHICLRWKGSLDLHVLKGVPPKIQLFANAAAWHLFAMFNCAVTIDTSVLGVHYLCRQPHHQRPLRRERRPLKFRFPKRPCSGPFSAQKPLTRCIWMNEISGCSYRAYEQRPFPSSTLRMNMENVSSRVPTCSPRKIWNIWRKTIKRCVQRLLRGCSTFGTSSCSIKAAILQCCPLCTVTRMCKRGLA